MPPVIIFIPKRAAKPENSDGTQILEEGVGRRGARDEEAQGRYVEERPLGQERSKSRKQAIAIGLSEARSQAGKKVPKKASKKRKASEEGFKEKDREEVEADSLALCSSISVMPGLVPGIHVLCGPKKEGVDGRDQARL